MSRRERIAGLWDKWYAEVYKREKQTLYESRRLLKDVVNILILLMQFKGHQIANFKAIWTSQIYQKTENFRYFKNEHSYIFKSTGVNEGYKKKGKFSNFRFSHAQPNEKQKTTKD